MTIQATITTLVLSVSLISGSWGYGGVLEAEPSGTIWLDAAGTPLPFQDESEILEFLRTARVVTQKTVRVGVNKISKVLLEKDGVQLHGGLPRCEHLQEPAHHGQRRRHTQLSR